MKQTVFRPSETDGRPALDRLLETPSYVELVYAIVFVWGFGDVVSTILAAELTNDPTLEANPLIQLLLVEQPILMIALKFAVVLYIGIVLLECRPTVERIPGWQAWLFGLFLAGVIMVVTNVFVGLALAT